MTVQDYTNNYWNQYLLLEKDVCESLQYVELDARNYQTFSQQFIKLLLHIGSEVDNVFREMCGIAGRSDISAYASSILVRYPNIVTQVVIISSKGMQLTPFRGWNIAQPSQSLQFWDNYNHIKHDRLSNIQEASFETVLNAIAALFTLEMYRFKELYNSDPNAYYSIPEEESKLFYLDSWTVHIKPSNIQAPYHCYDDDSNMLVL